MPCGSQRIIILGWCEAIQLENNAVRVTNRITCKQSPSWIGEMNCHTGWSGPPIEAGCYDYLISKVFLVHLHVTVKLEYSPCVYYLLLNFNRQTVEFHIASLIFMKSSLKCQDLVDANMVAIDFSVGEASGNDNLSTEASNGY